jgi:hypothetical protein
MSKPTIFKISARWNDEASVWSGHSDDIPAAADAPTLDELLAELSAMTNPLYEACRQYPDDSHDASSMTRYSILLHGIMPLTAFSPLMS